jgi:putative addiction module killer protein
MNTLLRTSEFDDWLKNLRNAKARARVVARLRSATCGNFGDSKALGGGVNEMRIDLGPGYRVYFARWGATKYVLLTGGDKSTQSTDIKVAREILREWH